MSLVTIILTLILMVWIPVLLWYLSVRKYESLEKIPGPKPLPIIGNAHHLGNSPRALLENFVRLHKKYGGIFKLFIGSEVRVVFAKPDNIQHILSSNIHINKSDQYDLLKPWLGEGLVTSGGAKWKSRRKMITPTFHFKILEKFVEVFNSQSDILIGILSRNTNKIIDVSSFMDMYALDVICGKSQQLMSTDLTENSFMQVFNDTAPQRKSNISLKMWQDLITEKKRFGSGNKLGFVRETFVVSTTNLLS